MEGAGLWVQSRPLLCVLCFRGTTRRRPPARVRRALRGRAEGTVDASDLGSGAEVSDPAIWAVVPPKTKRDMRLCWQVAKSLRTPQKGGPKWPAWTTYVGQARRVSGLREERRATVADKDDHGGHRDEGRELRGPIAVMGTSGAPLWVVSIFADVKPPV